MNPKLKGASWFFFGLFCLIFFTVLKLPRGPIKASIHALIADGFATQGVSLTSTEEDLSFFLLPTFQMKKVTLSPPPPAEPAHIDQITLSPLFLPLLLGRWGTEIQIQDGKGNLKASVSNRKSFVSTSYRAENLELGRLGVFPIFLGIQGSSILDGNGSVSMDTQALNQTDGTVNLQFSKISIEPQTIAGFSIPKINLSEAILQAVIEQGKAKITTLRLGKSGGSGAVGDDIHATLSGEITLGKTLEASTLNLKTKFSFSENFLKSFMLLDTLLGAGKQPDGSYAFSLTGPAMNPVPQPITGP
jgi:type II secretion system protein N